MTVWFTSDQHFGHRLPAIHRGFETTDEMDDALIKNWRRVVREDDQVWVLGDLCVSNPARALGIVRSLPGTKHLIVGNHDACHPMHRSAHKWQSTYLKTFASVQTFAKRKIAGRFVLLSHFPYEEDRGEPRYTQYRLVNQGQWLLHGHTHSSRVMTSSREIHVGVDAWDLTPVSLHQIERLMMEQMKEENMEQT